MKITLTPYAHKLIAKVEAKRKTATRIIRHDADTPPVKVLNHRARLMFGLGNRSALRSYGRS